MNKGMQTRWCSGTSFLYTLMCKCRLQNVLNDRIDILISEILQNDINVMTRAMRVQTQLRAPL